MITFKLIGVFVSVFCGSFLDRFVSGSTHWVVTENGRIQSQLDSAFHMRRPYDLLSLLEQEKRAEKIRHIFKEMLGRKAAIDVDWAGLDSATDLEVRLYENDKDCLQAGKPLTDMDLYDSVADDGFCHAGVTVSELLPSDVPEDTSDFPDCKEFSALDFSMASFPHLQALSWNLSSNAEILRTMSLGEQNPQLIAAGLKENKTSWFLYNLAAIYWRTQGDAQKSIACAKRAVHFSPRYYRDVPLLNLGSVLHQAKCLVEAAIVLHAAVDHAPVRPMAHYVLGNVYAVLGDYNRSVVFYENAIALKPHWQEAVKKKFAVLCHQKLELSLIQLHRSLQSILTQLHEYHELQELWLKLNEELMFQQAPLQVRFQEYNHETLTALLRNRDKCIQIVQDGNTILNCDLLLSHNLQVDITLSLQHVLKNVESQAQKISEQMSHRMTGMYLGTLHFNRMGLDEITEEYLEDTNAEDDSDNRLEIYVENIKDKVEESDNRSLDEILQEISEKLKDNVMDIVDDIVEKQHLGWFNMLKLRELSVLISAENQCHSSSDPLSGECFEQKVGLWSWNDGTDNQLFTTMGTSNEDNFFQNSCFQMRCHILSSLILTWFQLGERHLIEKTNMVSNETPKCSPVTHTLTDLAAESYGEIMPEPKLKPLLAALLDDENISLPDIAMRISHSLKVTTTRTVATAAALYWRFVGDAEQMVACLKLAVDVAPPNSKDSPLHNVAQILLTLGHTKEALLLATLALKVSPHSVFAHAELFHIYSAIGDKVKAVKFGRSAVSLQDQVKLLKKQ